MSNQNNKPALKRRDLITGSTALAGLAFGASARPVQAFISPKFQSFGFIEASTGYEIERTEAEWRALLTPEEFAVLRQWGTEPAFTSALNDEDRKGIYHCASCDLPAYDSLDKFDSGTGWPSFTVPLENAVRVRPDRKLFILRTEVHCRRCGGHFGHIFDDGPKGEASLARNPTGLRHCLNGLSLKFRPTA